MQISNGWKPLPGLKNAINQQQPTPKHPTDKTFGAGQPLPTGQSSPVPVTPPAPKAAAIAVDAPSLNFLTSLQAQPDSANS
jgi:hypothetical protein